MQKPLLSIIIVSYNTAKLTVETIASIQASFIKKSELHKLTEVIVVDNASQDSSIVDLAKLTTKASIPIKILKNKENLGFGRANNAGVAVAKGSYYLFLNSDTIVQTGALEQLVKTFQEHEKSQEPIGILAASLYNSDGTPQPQGGSLPSIFTIAAHMLMLDDLPLIGKWLPSTQNTGVNSQTEHKGNVLKTGWVGGTALFTSAAILQTIGLFDQNIFMYGEDTELCLRAHNHGYVVAIDPLAAITHLQNKSSSSLNALEKEFDGILYIFAKHTNTFQTTIVKGLMVVGAILRIFVFSTLQKNKDKVQVYKKVLRTMLS